MGVATHILLSRPRLIDDSTLYLPRFQDYVQINELGELVVLRIAIPESPRLPDKNADSWDSDLYPF